MDGLEIGKLIGYVELDDSGVAEGAKSAKERLTELGKSGKGLGALAGLGAGAALAAGLAGAMELEPAKAKLTAQLGLTASESKRIGGVAGNLYSGAYGDSLEQVNEAITNVIQNIDGMGSASSSTLEGMTAKVLAVSQTFDADLGETTRAVGQMMRTGLAKDAGQALDVITKGLQEGDNKAGDLFDTMNEYGTQFRKLGIDGPTAMGLITQGLKAGARDSDLVADSLKELSIRAVDGSQTTAAGFQTLGLSADGMAHAFSAGGATARQALDTTLERLKAVPDPVARSAAAVNLFGTQAEDLGQALYALDPTSAVTALGKVDGAAAQVAKTTGGTAVAQFQSFTRTLQTFAVNTVGDTVLPLVTKFGSTLVTVVTPPLKALGDVVGGAAHLFGELPGPIQTVAVTLGILIALNGPLTGMWSGLKTTAGDALAWVQLRAEAAKGAMAEGGLTSAIGAVAGAGEKAAAGGLGGLAAMLGGPLGIGIAAVSIGIPLLTSLFGHNDDAAAKAAVANTDLANAIKNAGGAIDDSVKKAAAKELQDKGLLNIAKAYGLSLEDVTKASLGNADAMRRVKDAIDPQIKSYQAAADAIHSTDIASALAKGTNDSQAKSLKDLEHQLESMSGTTSQSVKDSKDLAAATGQAGSAMDDTTQSAQQQTDALSALKAAMDRYSGNAISAAEAQIAVSDGLEKMTSAATAGARSFDLTTQSGRDSEKAALDQITAIQQLTSATFTATGSSEQAKAAWDREVGALRERLLHLGYNTGAVDTLIGTYAKIPASVFTTVGTNAGDALTVVSQLSKTLETISDGVYHVNIIQTTKTLSDGTTVTSRAKGQAYNATGALYHFYADGGLEGAQPMAAGVAAIAPAGLLRVIGDRAHGDEFYLPDDDADRTLALGHEWARRRGLSLVPVGRYAAGGTHQAATAPAPAATAPASSSSSSPAAGVLFTGPVTLRDQRDAQRLADEIDWRRRTRGRRR